MLLFDHGLVTDDSDDARRIVRSLVAALGPTVVAAVAGVQNRDAPYRWTERDAAVPAPPVLERLFVAHDVFARLSLVEGADVARAWMIGPHAELGGDTPITAIREGRFDAVRGSARLYLEA